MEDTELIAQIFESIFGQKDVGPTSSKQQKMQENLQYIQKRLQIEHKPCFTARELDQAIRKANMRSAKGSDGVSNRLIKTSLEEPAFHRLLLQAINSEIIRDGTYPPEFKKARIIPLPKAKAGEYRPISLLPSMSKLLEYMMQLRMRETLQINNLPPHQFGCRPGHSAAQALMRLFHYTGIAAGTNKQFGAILYDFVKAYDRVPKHIILDKMIDLNMPAYLVRMVHQWLTNRTFTVSYRNYESEIRPQTNAIPQGPSMVG